MRGILFRDDQSLFGSNWYKLPKKLFVIPFILSFLGLFTIYSLIGSEYSINFLFKHFFYLIISFIILFLFTIIPKNDLRKILNILALFFLILLILVPILGYEVKGATRWLNFKFFSIQPSELLKGPIICMFSWFCYLYIKTNKLLYLLINFFLMMIIISFLLLQPDIGTLLLYLSIFALLLILYFKNLKLFFLLFVVGIIFIITAYFSFDHVQSRVDKFLFSENTQVSKSISAIKEGGLFGVG
jgi:cell division protein FtsW